MADYLRENPNISWSPWLEKAMQALDYTAGVGRTAAAGLANIPYAAITGKSITQPEDVSAMLMGQAPTASEYLGRAGVGPTEDSPWARMGVDTAADIALDPTTYTPLGVSKIPVVAGAVMGGIKTLGKKGAGKVAKNAAEETNEMIKLMNQLSKTSSPEKFAIENATGIRKRGIGQADAGEYSGLTERLAKEEAGDLPYVEQIKLNQQRSQQRLNQLMQEGKLNPEDIQTIAPDPGFPNRKIQKFVDPETGKVHYLDKDVLEFGEKKKSLDKEADYFKRLNESLDRRGGVTKGFDELNYPYEIDVEVVWPDGTRHIDTIKGLNKGHAEQNARWNWEGADIKTLKGRKVGDK